MGRLQVASVPTSQAHGDDVVGLQRISGGGWSTAEVADGVGCQDAIAFFAVAVGIGAGSLSGGGVSPMSEAARSTCYGWSIAE